MLITGTVIKGYGYGRKLGFPTVNLEPDNNQEFPKNGVYSGTGILEGQEYRAGIVVGPPGKIEAHLIGYHGDAYGKEVTLSIGKFIREYQHFENEQELINQIKKDLSLC
jgi:riboflavin kinase/FMN adenylyltransferase